MKIIITILLTSTICFSQITIDFQGIQKPTPMSNYLGYGHDAFYYEQDLAYRTYHDLLIQAQHKRPLVYGVRFFNTLSYKENADGSLNSYAESIGGHPYDTKRYPGGYDFTKVNRVFDELVRVNLKPLVYLGFMPQCLSIIPVDEGSFGEAIISPPTDHNIWKEVNRRFILNLESRYGNKILDWHFGVWNEPNYTEFWDFGVYGYDGFMKIWDYANAGAKEINPNLKFTGPDNTDVMIYSKQFVQHCFNGTNYATGQVGTPIEDFTIHYYSKNPRSILKKVWQMQKDSQEIYGTVKKTMITETAPTSQMWAQPYSQNEYAAVHSLLMLDYCLEVADLYGQVYMPECILYHGDIRQFEYRSVMIYPTTDESRNTTQVLKSPLFNLWEMLSLMDSQRLQVTGCDFPTGALDINDTRDFTMNQFRAIATKRAGDLQVLVYNWNQSDRLVYNKDDDGANPPDSYGTYRKPPQYANTSLTVNNLAGSYRVKKYILDRYHSNVFGYKYDVNDTGNFTTLNAHDDLECVSDELILIGGVYQENLSLMINSIMLITFELDGEPPLIPPTPKNLRIEK